MICCEQEGEVAAAARDQLDYFEIQEFGNKDSYVFKVILLQLVLHCCVSDKTSVLNSHFHPDFHCNSHFHV